jgi:hypothetical protein
LADRAKLLSARWPRRSSDRKFEFIQNGPWFPASEVAEFALGKAAQDRGHNQRATGEVRWPLRAASVRAWLALAGALIRAGIRGWTVKPLMDSESTVTRK